MAPDSKCPEGGKSEFLDLRGVGGDEAVAGEGGASILGQPGFFRRNWPGGAQMGDSNSTWVSSPL